MANAKETSVSNDKFVAYIERYSDCALVSVFPKVQCASGYRYEIDFSQKLACYETASNGAMDSARREIKKLAEQVSA